MKATAWAALAALTALVGSVALQPQEARPGHRQGPRPAQPQARLQAENEADSSAQAVRESTRALANWASSALNVVSREGKRVALDLGTEVQSHVKQQTKSWPGLLAQPAAPTTTQLSRYEKQLCDLVNQERKKRGMSILKISPVLSEVARAHSRDMAANKYFAHESPTRGLKTPQDRYRARVKKTPRLIAENIYKLETTGFYRLKPEDFRRAHEGWMKSPGHRANILRTAPAGGPTQIGVGIVVRNGSFWATQNFARP